MTKRYKMYTFPKGQKGYYAAIRKVESLYAKGHNSRRIDHPLDGTTIVLDLGLGKVARRKLKKKGKRK